MGTRGVIGFVRNEREAIAYNHFDSFPSELGKTVVEFLTERLARDGGLDELCSQVEALKIVSDDVPPTRDEILAIRKLSSFHVNQFSADGPEPKDVSETSPDGLPDENVAWYNLLRNTQGEPDLILKYGYLEDASLFPLDSLFCEWGYVIDLDAIVLEVYAGWQKSRPTTGRWAGRPTDEENQRHYEEMLAYVKENGCEPWFTGTPDYHAIGLVASYPFDDLPTAARLEQECDPSEVEEGVEV